MSHPFGDLLSQYRARKHGLSQTRLAHLAGYDQAVLVRMVQGKKDLTGPSGRDRVVRVIVVLHTEGVLTTLGEANALLKAAGMAPLFDGQPKEATLIKTLNAGSPHPPHALRDGHTPRTPTPTMAPPTNTNLPAPLTSFVDRARELAAVRDRLLQPHVRLLTLVGPPGIGKTRLSLQAAQTVLDHFADGVWFVSLAPISGPALVLPAIARTFDIADAGATPLLARVREYLRPKQLLLVLDNFEQVLDAAPVVTDLLKACPRVKVLATSREPLHAYGEHEYPMPSLSLPPRVKKLTSEQLAEFDALKLFVARAQAIQPSFELSVGNAQAVAEICWRLDGVPLAIELAASRLRQFTVHKLRDALNDAPLQTLAGTTRDVEPRQRTLRAAIQWSYDLLSPGERAAFARLGVFVGSCSTEAALAVCELADDATLNALADRSLIKRDPNERWAMLEMIREFALDALAQTSGDELERAHQRHLAYFAGLAHTASTHWFGPTSKTWLDRLETELDNLRAALDWVARNQDVQTGAQLIGWMVEFWYERGYAVEGRRWIDVILPPSAGMSDVTRVNRLKWLGQLAAKNCDYVQARDRRVEAATLAHHLGDEWLIFQVNWQLSCSTADDAAAAQLLNDALRLTQRNGWKGPEAQIMYHLGRRMRHAGDYPGATQWLAASAHAYRELESPYFLAYCLGQLGMVALAQGNYVQARAQLEASSALAREAGDTTGTAEWLLGLSTVAVYQGDYGPATAALHEAITTYYQTGNLYRVAQGLAIAAHAALDRGQSERAARLLGAAAVLWRDFPADLLWYQPDLHREYDLCVPAVRAALDAAAFDSAWAQGQQMMLDQVMADVMAV